MQATVNKNVWDRALPGDASVGLSHDAAKGGKHSPAAVDQLALAEASEAEDLGVRLQAVCGDLVDNRGEGAENGSGRVVVGVLVKSIEIDLRKYSGDVRHRYSGNRGHANQLPKCDKKKEANPADRS